MIQMRGRLRHLKFIEKISAVFLCKIVSAGAGLLLTLLLTTNVSAEIYGEYAYFLGWGSLIAILATSGHDISLLRSIPISIDKKDWSEFRGLLRYIGAWLVLISPAIAVIFAASVFFVISPSNSPVKHTVIVALVAVSFAGKSIVSTIFRSLKSPLLAELFQGAIPSIVTLALIAIWIVFRDRLDGFPVATGAIIGITVATTMVCLLVAVSLIGRILPAQSKGALPASNFKRWWFKAVPHLFLSGCSVVLMKIDIVFLGASVEFSSVAKYQVAIKIAGTLTLVHHSITHVFAPMIAEMYHSKNMQTLQGYLRSASLMMFVITSFAAVILALFGSSILGLFGANYADAYGVLLTIMCGVLINAFCGPVGYVATMTGHTRLAATYIGAAAALNIILNAVLIPWYGLLGAASATAISAAFWNIGLAISMKKLTGLNTTAISLLAARKTVR